MQQRSVFEDTPTEAMSILLHANGVMDKELGTPMAQGWKEICKEFRWNSKNMTVARETYESGYNSV